MIWAAIVLHLASTACAGEWPQYQQGAQKLGVGAGERVSLPFVPKFSLVTTNMEGETVFNLASASVSGDTIYVGTTDGAAVAVGRKTGLEQWRVQTGAPICGAPAIVNGELLVGSSDGTLRALDTTAEGTELWRFAADGPVAASPTIATVGSEVRVFIGTTTGTLTCLRAEDGGFVWSAKVGGRIWGSPSVDEARGKVYVPSYDGSIHAFDVLTGKTEWTYDGGAFPFGPVRAALAVQPGRLYAATLTRGLFAVTTRAGMPKWHGRSAAPGFTPALPRSCRIGMEVSQASSLRTMQLRFKG